MPTYTKNYRLEKPTQTEKYNIKTWNKNLDDIDQVLSNFYERTNMSSPFVGTDEGNKIQTTLTEVQAPKSLNTLLTELLKTGMKQNVRFILDPNTDGCPTSSTYPWLIETVGFNDGVLSSNTIQIKAMETGGDGRTFITHYNVETGQIVETGQSNGIDQVFNTDLYPENGNWIQFYPSKGYDSLKEGISPTVITKGVFTSEQEEFNTLEKVVAEMIRVNPSSAKGSYAAKETVVLEDGTEEMRDVHYIIETIISSADTTADGKTYLTTRTRTSHPYTVDFNLFDAATSTFSLDAWKQIFPADGSGLLPEHIVTEEEDPVFMNGLGDIVPAILDSWISTEGGLLFRIVDAIKTYDNFQVIYIERKEVSNETQTEESSTEPVYSDTNWLINVSCIKEGIYSVYQFGTGTNAVGYYNCIENDEFLYDDWIQIYPAPDAQLNNTLLLQILQVLDPISEKTITIGLDPSMTAEVIAPVFKNHSLTDIRVIGSMSIADIQENVGIPDIHVASFGQTFYDNQLAIGEVSDSNFDETTWDPNTVAGYLDSVLYNVKTMWENTEYIVLIDLVPGIGTDTEATDTDPASHSSDSYIDTIIDICDKWGVMFIPIASMLNTKSQINAKKYVDSENKLTKEAYLKVFKYLDKTVFPRV